MKKTFITAMLLAGTATLSAQTIYTGDGILTGNRIVRLSGRSLNFQSTLGQLFINGTTGSVGVNTNSPTEVLDVIGNIKGNLGIFQGNYPTTTQTATFASWDEMNNKCRVIAGGALLNQIAGSRTFGYYDYPKSNLLPNGAVFLTVQDRNYSSRYRFWADNSAGSYMNIYDSSQQVNFTVTDDGSNNITLVMPKENSFLGIGTSSFTDGADVYKLSVNGNIRAHRVKVYTTWADYVFEEDYKLPTLEEVEQHIVEKGHLIDIPSAQEVEENGIELGEMNKLLLQKIEELTLYTIEMNKQVQELKAELNKQ
ncbi:hypothetical protein E0W68_11830 [Flavobacterium salilacus subsp. salilacus]|uniref:hypothetical protein n=1 Tax=Flavobacterium TaxID=237 RepID=UPI001074AE7B|nr:MULTISPECIES: hypothetical protein [Flavobacterium]KAF2516898.1 hypothetical protein E0W68_11830 [Flavobacterium salilacus subsp. salilacus]MBE1615742.1 hypothetical protein [Flavobacterium sp. SaA2.13]